MSTTFTPRGSGSFTIASQAEAEAGVNNTKGMTPLRVAQAIAASNLIHGTLNTEESAFEAFASDGVTSKGFILLSADPTNEP